MYAQDDEFGDADDEYEDDEDDEDDEDFDPTAPNVRKYEQRRQLTRASPQYHHIR